VDVLAGEDRRSSPFALAELATWPLRRWLTAVAGAAVVGLAIGVPTDLLPTPLYSRMTAVAWWSYPVWALSALLAGLVLATYVRAGPAGPPGTSAGRGGARGAAGGLLSFLAVGCPTCNKLVVVLLGTGGALGYFAPVQPALALLGLALLAATLVLRLRAASECRIPATSHPAP
jgi:hypothetical protein